MYIYPIWKVYHVSPFSLLVLMLGVSYRLSVNIRPRWTRENVDLNLDSYDTNSKICSREAKNFKILSSYTFFNKEYCSSAFFNKEYFIISKYTNQVHFKSWKIVPTFIQVKELRWKRSKLFHFPRVWNETLVKYWNLGFPQKTTKHNKTI